MKKLEPLDDLKAFDGDKFEVTLPRDASLPKRCTHKDMKAISSQEIRCSCGTGYTGSAVLSLLKEFTK